jgi:hypothetical protein
MRTAIISDLHLGAASSTDLAADPDSRAILLEELQGADRIVLLGDTLELRDRPLGEVLELATPFLRDLGEAAGTSELILVPGNHDHRLAEPLLDRQALGRARGMQLEQFFKPTAGAAASLARRLGRRDLVLAYPGIWLRDDVYAIHGHYLDCHLTLPRLESLGVAAAMRITGEIPDPAAPDDYERPLAPLYSLTYGLAQAGATERLTRHSNPSATVWARLQGQNRGLRGRLFSSVLFPGTVGAARKLLRRPFDSDISPGAISRSGVDAMRTVVRRLHIESAHVLFGHTHRSGPAPEEGDWRQFADGPALHNTGTWSYARALCAAPDGGRGFWPGTVTWVDESGPPRRSQTLAEFSGPELRDAARRIRSARSHPQRAG